MKILDFIKVLNLKWHNKYGLDIEVVPIQGGIQLFVGYKGAKFTVRVYPNKGDIRLDFSQVQNSLVEKDLKAMLDGTYVPNEDPIYESSRPDVLVAGFDESGKGDIFGGIMFAGVYIDKPYNIASEVLSSIGIKDSKDMFDDEVVKAYKVLTNMSGVTIVTNYCDPVTFNKYQKEGKKANIIMQDFHLKTISDLLQKVESQLPNVILIDQFCDEEWLQNAVIGDVKLEQGPDLRYRYGTTVVEQRPHGEENLLVAAASVVARYNYLTKMDDLGLEYGLEFPRGANKSARAFYHNNVESIIPDDIKECLMKTSFKIV